MAVTEERLSTPATSSRDRTESPPRSRVTAPRDDTLWTRVLLIAWMVGFGGLVLFEPTPDQPSVPAWATIVSLTFLLALGATLTGLASRRPWALKASGVTAGAGLVLAAACAQTGHHAGAWWAVEFAVFAVLLGATQIARRETTPRA